MSKTIKVFIKNYDWQVQLEWKLQDFWIGAFWKNMSVYSSKRKKNINRLDVWVCLLPCLPIHIIKFE